jgi:hypothetical protein
MSYLMIGMIRSFMNNSESIFIIDGVHDHKFNRVFVTKPKKVFSKKSESHATNRTLDLDQKSDEKGNQMESVISNDQFVSFVRKLWSH